MTESLHITAGRTAFRMPLVMALLTTTVVGVTGTTTGETNRRKGNDVCPCGYQSVRSLSFSTLDLGSLDAQVETLTLTLTTALSQDKDPD